MATTPYGGGGGGSWGGINPYAYQYTPTIKKTANYWTEYQKAMEKQYGIRQPTSVTYAPKAPTQAPVTPTQAPVAQAPSTPSAPSYQASAAGRVSLPSVPTFQAPQVPDYRAIAQEWLAKFPELFLPEEERAAYLSQAGEEIRPMFEAQESKIKRESGEEELERVQELYGRGLIGGITIENLVDVKNRLNELLTEMAYKEESLVAQRATEIEQLDIQNAMAVHAQRVQGWAMQYGVDTDSARQTFVDQMTRVGFQAEQANASWTRSFSEAQLGLEYEKFDWTKAFDEAQFEWQKGQEGAALKIVDNTPTWVIDETEPTSTSSAYQRYLLERSTIKPAYLYTQSEFHKRGLGGQY